AASAPTARPTSDHTRRPHRRCGCIPRRSRSPSDPCLRRPCHPTRAASLRVTSSTRASARDGRPLSRAPRPYGTRPTGRPTSPSTPSRPQPPVAIVSLLPFLRWSSLGLVLPCVKRGSRERAWRDLRAAGVQLLVWRERVIAALGGHRTTAVREERRR